MINVGIYGAATPCAGELLRILVNHPDVMIRCAVDSGLSGCEVTSAHHGLIGECSLDFSDSLDLSRLDVLFITASGNERTPELRDMIAAKPDLRVVDLVGAFAEERIIDTFTVYGVPELNRKSLVRGARHVVIPSALESVSTVALLPLAMRAMLPATLPLRIEAAPDVTVAQPRDISNMLRELAAAGAKPFDVSLTFADDATLGRVIRISCDLELPVPIDNITDMYEELYDDHNLTFIVGEEVAPDEVEGTDKCVISLDKSPEGSLQLRAIADARMRGGAGDAVHVMNLLMGLYEKTGLALKASRY